MITSVTKAIKKALGPLKAHGLGVSKGIALEMVKAAHILESKENKGASVRVEYKSDRAKAIIEAKDLLYKRWRGEKLSKSEIRTLSSGLKAVKSYRKAKQIMESS